MDETLEAEVFAPGTTLRMYAAASSLLAAGCCSRYFTRASCMGLTAIFLVSIFGVSQDGARMPRSWTLVNGPWPILLEFLRGEWPNSAALPTRC
ncbi:hypothetical protein D3C87_1971400 [compost metagenome]